MFEKKKNNNPLRTIKMVRKIIYLRKKGIWTQVGTNWTIGEIVNINIKYIYIFKTPKYVFFRFFFIELLIATKKREKNIIQRSRKIGKQSLLLL